MVTGVQGDQAGQGSPEWDARRPWGLSPAEKIVPDRLSKLIGPGHAVIVVVALVFRRQRACGEDGFLASWRPGCRSAMIGQP